MPRMIVNPGQAFEYEGRKLKPGDEFDVPDMDSDRWVLFGMCTRVDTSKRPPGRSRKADPEPGTYNRSDLRANE